MKKKPNETIMLYDEVRHRKQREFTGIVLACYSDKGVSVLDVRLSTDEIKYATPADNWELVRREEAMF